jgi:hypothetical protein
LTRTPTDPAASQMKTRFALEVSFAALFASFASIPAPADTPLGVYVGAAFGASLSRSGENTAFDYNALRFHQDGVARKGFVGIRPLPMLGVELAYIDFGNASGPPPPSTIFGYFKDNSKETATTLFGVGYLPLSVPFLKLYGKLGAARLHTDAQVSYLPPTCPLGLNCTVPYTVRQNKWTTDFAYGAGAQARFGSVGIRAEYERISASGGNPDLFSLGLAWIF